VNTICQELIVEIEQTIAEIQAEIEAYDERLAIQAEQNDGKTTTELAIEALRRPERLRGEHDVARAWLRQCEPQVRIFQRVTR
jgi:hypothetical protein